jgi:beta-glucanase (GH16 family)
VTSASIKTAQSFTFKFGRIAIRAKMPQGDWLWPVISLIPKTNVYGPWPASGQVTVAESRGNANLKQNGQSIGNDLLVSTLHFGPTPALNRYYTALYQKRGNNFVSEFHNYEIEWSTDYIVFRFDEDEYGVVKNNYDFWRRGFFPENVKNPWTNGTSMAPFDQEFYLELRLGIGGTNGYFPDVAVNGGGKPWATNSRTAATDFWNGRESWTRTWGLGDADDSSNLQIDYVRIWAN